MSEDINYSPEQIRSMIDACRSDIDAEEWADGGALYASPIGAERDFMNRLHEVGERDGYAGFAPEEIARLCRVFSKA